MASLASPSPGKSPAGGGQIRGTANADGKQLEDLLHAASALRARWSVSLGDSGPDLVYGEQEKERSTDRDVMEGSPARRAPVSSSVVRVTRDHLARTRQELDALRAEREPITYTKASASRPRSAQKPSFNSSPVPNTWSPDPSAAVRSPTDSLRTPAGNSYQASAQTDDVSQMRAALSDLEAQLLKVRGDLVREKEEHKASKAKLAVEMQARLRSAEAAMLESHTALRERLKKAQDELADTKKQLQDERRSGIMQEAELEELVSLREKVRKLESPAQKELRDVITSLENRLADAKEELRKEQDAHRAERRRAQELEDTVKDLRDEESKLQILLRAAEDDLARERSKSSQPSDAVKKAQGAINTLEEKLIHAETTAEMYGKQLQALKDQSALQEQVLKEKAETETEGLKQKLDKAKWEADKARQELEDARQREELTKKDLDQAKWELERAKKDIERLEHELESKGQTLKEYMQKAESTLEKAEGLKMELDRAKLELDRAERELDDVRQKSNDVVDKAKATSQQLEQGLRQELAKVRLELDRAGWELDRANKELEDNRHSLNESIEKVQTTSQQQEQGLRQELEGAKQELARTKWELDRSSRELVEARQQLQSDLDKGQSALQQVERELRHELGKKKTELDRANWELEKANREVERTGKELSETKKKLSEALERAQMTALQHEHGMKQEMDTLNHELDKTKWELDKARREVAESRQQLKDELDKAMHDKSKLKEQGLSSEQQLRQELERAKWELDQAHRDVGENKHKLQEAVEREQTSALQVEKRDIKVRLLEERLKAAEEDRERDRLRFTQELDTARAMYEQGSAASEKNSQTARDLLEVQYKDAQAELRSVSATLEQALEKLKQERTEAQRVAQVTNEGHGTQKALLESQLAARGKELDAARDDVVNLRREMSEAEARARHELDNARQTAETFKAEANAFKGQLERLRSRQEEMMSTMGDLKNLLSAQAERAVASEKQLAEREISWREASHRAQDEIAALRLQVLEAEGRFRAAGQQTPAQDQSKATPKTPATRTASGSSDSIVTGGGVRATLLELELGGMLLSEVDDLATSLLETRQDLACAANVPEQRVKIKGVHAGAGLGFTVVDVELRAAPGVVTALQNQIGNPDSDLMNGTQTGCATAMRVVQTHRTMLPPASPHQGATPARLHQADPSFRHMERAVGISPIRVDRSVDASPSKVDRGQDVGVNDQSLDETLELTRALDAKNRMMQEHAELLEKREVDVRRLEEGLVRAQLSQEAALQREQSALAKLEAARERERLYEGAEVALERLRAEKARLSEEAGALRDQLSEARSELVSKRVDLDRLRSMEGELERAKEELAGLRRVRVELLSARSDLEEQSWQLTGRLSRAAADRVAMEEEIEHWKNAAGDRTALREDVEHWRKAASEVLVLKEQVEELKKVAAERVPVEERDALLQQHLEAVADRVMLDEEMQFMKRQLTDLEGLRSDLEHWKRKASEGLALRSHFETVRSQAEAAEHLRQEVARWKAVASSRAGVEDEVERWRREASTFEVEVREIREAMQGESMRAREHIRRLEEERFNFDKRLDAAFVETEEVKNINDKLSEKIKELHEQLQQKAVLESEFKTYKVEMSRHLYDLQKGMQKGNPDLVDQLTESLRISTQARNEAELYASRARAAERRLEEREKALDQIRSGAEDSKKVADECSSRAKALERQVASLGKEKQQLEEQIEALRQKLEAERATARRTTQTAEERLEETTRKQREENDALRRELRAQALTITSMKEAAIAAESQMSQQGLSEEAVRALERRISQLQAEKQGLAGELAWAKEDNERLRNVLLKKDGQIAMAEEQIRVLRSQEAIRSHTHSPPRSVRGSPARDPRTPGGGPSPPSLSLGTPQQRMMPTPQQRSVRAAPEQLPMAPVMLPSQYPVTHTPPPRPESPGYYDNIGLLSDASLTPRHNAMMVHATIPEVGSTFPTNPNLQPLSTAKPTYYGELEDGWPHGRGITVWADGRVYDGHWIRGVFSGLGTCVWYNGDTYEGEWHDGFAHGLGRYTFSNGDSYEGTVQQDKFHGHGAFIHSSGWKYRGQWDNCTMHGWGLVIFPTGEKIKQHFIRGRPSSAGLEASDELYSQMLMAVSEVVTTVRQQTQAIRESRAHAKNILMAREANRQLSTTSPALLPAPGPAPPWRAMFPPIQGDRTPPPRQQQQLALPAPAQPLSQPMGGMSPGQWSGLFPGELMYTVGSFKTSSVTPRMAPLSPGSPYL